MLGDLTATQVLADWEASLDRVGEVIEIGRQTGANVQRVQCRARVKEYRAETLVGAVQQGWIEIKVFYPDLVQNQFPLPVRNTDHVVIRGQQKQINAVDANTGRISTTQIFLKIRAAGS